MTDGPTFIEKSRWRRNTIARFTGALIVGAVVVAATSGGISTQAANAHFEARAHAVTAIQVAQHVASADLRSATATTRFVAAATMAAAELTRAQGILDSSANKASEAGRTALAQGMSTVTTGIDGTTAYLLTASVMTLRENEKAVTDSVAAWEAAEQARLAAAAAAAAAAVAASEYANRSTARTYSSNGASSAFSPRSSSGAPTAQQPASTPYYAPGVPHERPSNDGCGPCDGATLVLTASGYWGCPL